MGDAIEKIRIGHDNRGVNPGWHLDRVEIDQTIAQEGKGMSKYLIVISIFIFERSTIYYILEMCLSDLDVLISLESQELSLLLVSRWSSSLNRKILPTV